MTLLKAKECKPGMVVLLTNPAPTYSIGPSNPLVGTPFECEGTVSCASKSSIAVRWKNGGSNSYRDNELSLFRYSLNYEGYFTDIWQDI